MAYRLSRKLFVSNIPWTVGQKEFYEYFASFGPLVAHNVVFDKTTGLSKKFGFIQFGNEDGYQSVLKQKTHYLDGQILNVEDKKELDNRNNFLNNF